MRVHVLRSLKKGRPAEPADILGCGSKVAEYIPSTVKNDDTNRRLQREAFGKESPDEWSDPVLMFKEPDRWVRMSTALKMGRVVNAETGEEVMA